MKKLLAVILVLTGVSFAGERRPKTFRTIKPLVVHAPKMQVKFYRHRRAR